MDKLIQFDWTKVFVLTTPPLELVVRASLTYLGIVILLRLILRRDVGELSVPDLLLLALLGDAAQDSMADNYGSVTGGIIVIGTILLWNYALNYLSYRFRIIDRIMHPAPILLVRNGVMMRRAMRAQLISIPELYSLLREEGVSDLSQVVSAYLEGDGRLSVTTTDEKQQQNDHKTRERKET